MVDTDLTNAAEEIRGEFEQLDAMSIAVTGGGIGIGLFGAEFVAEIAGNTFAPGGGRTRTIVEILSKFGMSGAFILGRNLVGGQLLGVVMILAAAGSAASGLLQVMEAVLGVLQTGEIAGAPAEASADSVSQAVSDASSASSGTVENTELAAT